MGNDHSNCKKILQDHSNSCIKIINVLSTRNKKQAEIITRLERENKCLRQNKLLELGKTVKSMPQPPKYEDYVFKCDEVNEYNQSSFTYDNPVDELFEKELTESERHEFVQKYINYLSKNIDIISQDTNTFGKSFAEFINISGNNLCKEVIDVK